VVSVGNAPEPFLQLHPAVTLWERTLCATAERRVASVLICAM